MGDSPVGEGASAPLEPTQSHTQSWTIVSATGPLALARSGHEFCVYDANTVFGRWPLSAEGERYARETYEAHRQSLAHGIAYSATGYQDPARLGLPVDPVLKSQTYASPMSYVGSTRRILAWAKKAAVRNAGVNVVVWIAAVSALLFMWIFLLMWYFVVFGLFGVFVFPFRMIRRSQRKSQHVQQQSLATQQAMYQQMVGMQQAAMRQPPASPPAQPPGRPQLPPQP
ncbi:MAG: hypothetical protein M0Z46_09180 [Actinomycetota bacterium]|nr:hypothetical protein [Actinomycetota bacterium]